MLIRCCGSRMYSQIKNLKQLPRVSMAVTAHRIARAHVHTSRYLAAAPGSRNNQWDDRAAQTNRADSGGNAPGPRTDNGDHSGYVTAHRGHLQFLQLLI